MVFIKIGEEIGYRVHRYAHDVDPQTHAFTNRRVLAYIDAGIPDGIQVDTQGNVFTSCADGVQVSLNAAAAARIHLKRLIFYVTLYRSLPQMGRFLEKCSSECRLRI